MLAALVASLVLAGQQVPPVPVAPQVPPAAEEPTTLEDVVVDARTIREEAEEFVDAVAAPAVDRGLARWTTLMCVGVGNLRPDLAQAVIDHISRVATEFEVSIGGPGCQPNVMIIFSDDARGLATALVDENRRAFRLGVGGLDRGNAALRTFQTSDKPVRWWHTSMPVIGGSQARAIRLPGDTAPIYVPGEGRVNKGRPIADQLNKVIIIVDADQMAGANYAQLGDYLAMVALAQVDPDGDTRGQDTILNVFNDPQGVHGLSEWDRTYLRALYEAYPERQDRDDQSSALARTLTRARREEQRATPQN